jgi:uncharacterized protein YggL (DUF469 family)
MRDNAHMLEIPLLQYFSSGVVIAAGATLGTEHFEQIMTRIAPEGGTGGEELLVVVNFDGINDATPSYLKATLLALHQCGRRFAKALTIDEQTELGTSILPLNIAVVVQNAAEQVQDCINEVFARRGLGILAGTNLANERFLSATLLGSLESTVLQTLMLTCSYHEFQASDLFENQASSGAISINGWNNRLAELYRHRLVRRRIEGRINRFISITNQVTSHGEILSRK